jgi:hypothetical protein
VALQTSNDQYRDHVDTLQAQLEELQQEGQGLQANATRLRADLDRANATIDYLQRNLASSPNPAPAPTPGYGAPPPRQKTIPDPEKFTGERKELKPFLSQVLLKLQGNDTMFPNLALRLAYVSSLVKGPAYAHIEEHIEDGFARIPDIDSLLGILSTAFGDPDEVGTAEREMKSLRQKNSDFATYFAVFQRLMTILRWDSRSKRVALREGLSIVLKDALLFIEEKEEFGAYVTQLQNMDNRIHARAQEAKVAKVAKPRNTTAPALNSTYHAPTRPDEPSFRPGGTVPMALDASRRISAEERQRRMQEGLCAYCAGSGHFARECPNKRPRPLRIAETSAPAPAPAQPAKNEPTRE